MDHNTAYIKKQFEIIVKIRLEIDLILYTNKNKQIFLKNKYEKIDPAVLQKIVKIYLDGNWRFIWTNLQNVIVYINFEKLDNETDEDIMKMYEGIPVPYDGFKYYSTEDLNKNKFDDILVNSQKIKNNEFEFNINEEKMLNLNIDIHYIFYSNISKIIWVNENNTIKKIVVNSII